MQGHILVIDDDRLIGKTLKKLLTKEGFRVTLASSGEEALIYVEKESFDLIVSDLKMPGMDGVETVASIRLLCEKKRFRPIPEIFITGFAKEEIFRRALDLEAAAYIEKPFDLKAMMTAIMRSIKKEGVEGG